MLIAAMCLTALNPPCSPLSLLSSIESPSSCVSIHCSGGGEHSMRTPPWFNFDTYSAPEYYLNSTDQSRECSSFTKSAALSATARTILVIVPCGSIGNTLASTTLKPSTP